MQYPVGHEKTEACVINTIGVSGPGLASYIMSVYMMSKHVKLLRLGKKNAKELTTGSVDPAAIADSCLEDPL